MTATMFACHGWNVVAFGPSPNPHQGGPWSWDRGTAKKLNSLVGRKITFYNLFEAEPEKWSREEARESAERWCLQYGPRLGNDVPLLLLGTKVCDAFGIENPHWLEVYASQLWRPMVAVPHPSGLNRWYNDPENEERARRMLWAIGRGTYFNINRPVVKEETYR